MDLNGQPLRNGYIRFRHNLSSKIDDLPTIWSDPDMGIALPNPLPLEFDGFVPMSGVWLDISNNAKYSIDVMRKIGERPSEDPDAIPGEMEPIYETYWTMDNLPGFDFETIGNIYSNVDALNEVPDDDHASALLNGYWKPGDKGGGWFWWDKDSTEAEDRGVVFRPSGVDAGNSGRWKRLITGSVMHSAFWGVYGREQDVATQFGNMQNWLIQNPGFILCMNAGETQPDGQPYTAKLGNSDIDFTSFKAIWEKGCVVDNYLSINLRSDCELPRGLVFADVHGVAKKENLGISCRFYVSNFNNEATLSFIRDNMNLLASTLVFDAQLLGGGEVFFDKEINILPYNTGFEVLLDNQPGQSGRKVLKFNNKPALLKSFSGINFEKYTISSNDSNIRLSDFMSIGMGVYEVTDDSFIWDSVDSLVFDINEFKLYINKPGVRLAVEKNCNLAGNCSFLEVSFSGGAQLDMENYTMVLHSNSIFLRGDDFITAEIGTQIIPNDVNKKIVYSGNLRSTIYKCSRIIFSKATISLQEIKLDCEWVSFSECDVYCELKFTKNLPRVFFTDSHSETSFEFSDADYEAIVVVRGGFFKSNINMDLMHSFEMLDCDASESTFVFGEPDYVNTAYFENIIKMLTRVGAEKTRRHSFRNSKIRSFEAYYIVWFRITIVSCEINSLKFKSSGYSTSVEFYRLAMIDNVITNVDTVEVLNNNSYDFYNYHIDFEGVIMANNGDNIQTTVWRAKFSSEENANNFNGTATLPSNLFARINNDTVTSTSHNSFIRAFNKINPINTRISWRLVDQTDFFYIYGNSIEGFDYNFNNQYTGSISFKYIKGQDRVIIVESKIKTLLTDSTDSTDIMIGMVDKHFELIAEFYTHLPPLEW